MKLLLILAAFVVTIGLAIAVPTLTGDDEGTQATGVSLTVTREYGNEAVAQSRLGSVARGETVMRLLQRELEVDTRYGGGFVQSIEGFAGGREDGRPVDWFYYLNGIEASEGAASRRISPGDRIWWDLHDWGTVMRVPAVVGSFPAPFTSRSGGDRLPVRIDCAEGADRICDEVTTRLAEAGVETVARADLNSQAGPELLRIVVGPWSAIRGDATLRQLEDRPRNSGVFARFEGEGRRLLLYDERGEVVHELDAGAGLVAAVDYEGQQPIWVVTGTDMIGASAAAAMLQESILARHFALAVEEGQTIGVPVPDAADAGA